MFQSVSVAHKSCPRAPANWKIDTERVSTYGANRTHKPFRLRAAASSLLLDVVRGLVATRSASFDAERSEKADADDAGTGRSNNGEPVAGVGEPHEQKRGNHDRRRQRKDDPPEDS